MTKVPVAALCIAGLVLVSASRPTPDPVAILHKANAATGQVPGVRYTAIGWGADGLEDLVPPVEARVWGRRTADPRAPHVRIEARMELANAVRKQALITDGKHVRFDSGGETEIMPIGNGIATMRRLTGTMWFQEFGLPTPFSDELAADIIQYEGRQAIAGEPCDVIYVSYNGRRGEARWYFSVNDSLPRRVARIVGRGARVVEIRNLEVTETLPASLFELAQNAPATPENKSTAAR